MNNIIQTLLGGTALCALATAPAMAGDIPDFHVFELHPGHAKLVSKTGMHTGAREHISSTISISTSIPAELGKTEKLPFTLATYCGSKLGKFKVTKKATYGHVGVFTSTVSTGCIGGQEVYFGNTYKLTKPDGEGKTDTFSDSLTDKFTYNGVKYNALINLNVQLSIGE
jgi:hypothetical protein